jgi:hypothetical protein
MLPTRRRLLDAVAASCVLACLPALPASGATAPTPPGQVLVVINNLHSDSRAETRRLSEARVLARRVLEDVRYYPDAILLQEVVRKSARKVAQMFTRMTGNRYVAARSARTSWNPVGRRRVVNTDTAIVVNVSTMRKTSRGGWIKSPYARRHAVGTLVVRRHAYVAIAERRGNVRMPLVSTHWVRPSSIETGKLARRYQNRWAKRIASVVDRRYPRAGLKVVGGDFNQNRCVYEPSNRCRPLSPFYRTLRNRRNRYVDAIFRKLAMGGVDYLFATARVLDAGVDVDYDKNDAQGDPSQWYSDHKFRWALLAPRG